MTLHPALQRRIRERDRLLDIARSYARRLNGVLPIRWAVVAGSVARGDFNVGSDIDILVVSDALPSHPLRRAELLYSVADGGVEPKGWTAAELVRELKRHNPFVAEVINRGVVVHPDGGSLDALRRDLGLTDEGS